MPIRFVQKYTEGFEVIIEAEEGHMLLGGRQVDRGAVFDRFADALLCMNLEIEDHLKADRRVKLGKVVEFRGMVSSFIHVPDRPRPHRPLP